MRAYTENQIKHISDDGSYKVIEIEWHSYTMPSRVYAKYGHDDDTIDLRIGNKKAEYYDMTIPADIDYKKAYELQSRLFKMTGISKADIEVVMLEIEINIKENQ